MSVKSCVCVWFYEYQVFVQTVSIPFCLLFIAMAKSKAQIHKREIDRRAQWLQAYACPKEQKKSNKQLVLEHDYVEGKLEERDEQVRLHIKFLTH